MAGDNKGINIPAVLLGFACDEGVRRNNGRVGAAAGPEAIRQALAKVRGWEEPPFRDAGNVRCDNGDLEAAQAELGSCVAELLQQGEHPILLGGGHEIAWGSHQGIRNHLDDPQAKVGIINFDAHFDLRDPAPGGNSGTPFRQIAEHCGETGAGFHYMVLGINPAANAPDLFDFAELHGAIYREDRDIQAENSENLRELIAGFVDSVDYLHLSICLDAFPASVAPGVSAPGVPGICPHTGLQLLRDIVVACQAREVPILLLEVAEMNPEYDRDGITARWAARLLHAYLESIDPDKPFGAASRPG